MDSKHAYDVAQCYRLLALCARAEPHPLMDEQLTRQVEAFIAWGELPAQAELHGMAPLLRYHLNRLGLAMPKETKQILNGLYLRHRNLNRAHTRVLLEVIALFEVAGIRALVLKGLALAHEYYPEPALRPTSDIDLLLRTEDILPALDVLKDAGFSSVGAPLTTRDLIPKELIVNAPPKNGIATRVELHHYDPRNRSVVDGSVDDEFSSFHAPSRKVKAADGFIYVPDPLDTLHYLFRHLTRHMFVANDAAPLPLRWLADIVCLIEHHAEDVNWAGLLERDTHLRNRLEVIYGLTPFPERLAERIPIKKISPPAGVNQYPQGWPQQVNTEWKRFGFFHYLKQTILSPAYIWNTLKSPSPWWLRLQYGIDDKSVFLYGQIVYRLHVLKIAFAKVFR